MLGSKRTWKTLPVWFVIALLVVALVGAAGAWMLQLESSVRYDEPFTVRYSDELNDEWKVIEDFPHEVEKDSIDLTYGTYHDFINITSQRRRPVEVISAFSVKNGEALETDHIGFVILEGLVDPANVTWNENGTSVSHGENSSEIQWGYHSKSITLEVDNPQTYTVITVLSNDAPLDQGDGDLSINWQFSRAEVRPGPFDSGSPTLLRGPYNLTPYILLGSVIITILIGFVAFKDSWEVG